MKKPYAILILDGFGERERAADNAITLQGTPNIDRYKANYPYTTLGASGGSVGLPDGQMGNSTSKLINFFFCLIVKNPFKKKFFYLLHSIILISCSFAHCIEHILLYIF